MHILRVDDVIEVQIARTCLGGIHRNILLEGWATAEWGPSEANRKVRFYKLTRDGRKQLVSEWAMLPRGVKLDDLLPGVRKW